MLNQEADNFLWFVMTDPKLDHDLLLQLQALLESRPNFYLVASNAKLLTPANLTSLLARYNKSTADADADADADSYDFVPYPMSFDDWMDEFCVYNYRMLLGSVRRFHDGRGPPYNIVGSTAALWRCDDRGSIGYARMVQDLTEKAAGTSSPSIVDNVQQSEEVEDRRLTHAEAALWGAIIYRVMNRLSTFSRWAAIKKMSIDEDKSISKLLNEGLYESAVHGTCSGNNNNNNDNHKGGKRNEDLHAIAASGVTLLGRMGYRDKWGKDFCLQQMNSKSPICCVSQLPLPTELEDFKLFTDWEKHKMKRGVMTGEHQVQPYEVIMDMLRKLVANNCSQLKKMSKVFMATDSAKVVLDELKKLPMVADFFSWQIFSDLVCVQYYRPLYPDNTILPLSVVNDSRFNYGLFGPGARKGANMIFGKAANQLEFNKNVSQAVTIPRAVEIRSKFRDALIRTKLERSWEDRAFGREYDLETVEHSLCGFYGVMHNLNINVLLSDEKASKEMEKVAKIAKCVWPPGSNACCHSSSIRDSDSQTLNKIQQRQGMGRWKPHPCTDLERQDLIQRSNHYKATAAAVTKTNRC